MISGLRGFVRSFGASKVYLDVSGVEYEVNVPLNVFEKLQSEEKDREIFLYIHHQFLQDEQRLFGFLEKSQREFFSAIQNIKGLGSALSLSVLSHLSAAGLIELCESRDITSLCKIPRIGKSTAETLVFEINRKIDRWKKIIGDEEKKPSLREDDDDVVLQALLQLGYRENQIRSAAEKLKSEIKSSGASLSISEKIHRCLQII